MDWSLRLAETRDIPALETLIPLSVRTLQSSHYTAAQMEAALGPVFGVDRRLIEDRTYFVAEARDAIIAGGGWSRREALFGGDRERAGQDALLDPARDAARIRAFFVHPDWARRGIGRALLEACETAIRAAGFHHAELVATLTGERLYARGGYQAIERYNVPLRDGVQLPAVRMHKIFPQT